MTDFPDEPNYREGLGLILNNLGSLYTDQGKTGGVQRHVPKGVGH